MSSHSPQRHRKTAGTQSTPTLTLGTQQGREASPSPSFKERSRSIKTHSMPLAPSSLQILTASAQQQASQSQLPSPRTLNGGRRSPQLPIGQVQRGLPTPPHPAIPHLPEQISERMSPHQPQPRVSAGSFLANFQGSEQWEMTDQLMAEIDAADRQAQGHALYQTHPSGHNHPKTDSPSRDPNLRMPTGKASPKTIERRRQWDQQLPRDSPKSRDHPSISPAASNLNSEAQTTTPERRGSPVYQTPLGSPNEHPTVGYSNSPTLVRRDSRPMLSLATNVARSPDRSLPVQEEPDDPSHDPREPREQNTWNTNDHIRQPSPTPSSDLDPSLRNSGRYEPGDGRSSRAGHRGEDDDTLIEQDNGSLADARTPRSPTIALPAELYQRATGSRRSRVGSTDQLGLQGFDAALFGHQQQPTSSQHQSELPPQYVEHRKHHSKPRQDIHQPPDPRLAPYMRYYATPHYSDDVGSYMEDPTSSYIQAYLRSPRPEAPVPPTPRSQAAEPSSASYDPRTHNITPFSPVLPVGSPYPYPFTHVRRNASYPGHSSRPSNYDPNHPASIAEQVTKQYQIYAQNTLGHVSDSTLSPSATPYPSGGYFNHWANYHTQRVLAGQGLDMRSLASSPSHEPVAVPRPPAVGIKRNPNQPIPKRTISMRKPPPRVDSTQPRETSPEPSSSGESTAGEERFAIQEEGNWVNGTPIEVQNSDDNDEWIDEEDEDDDDDLLELEFHPTFVSNIEKRRRRWQSRWEALMQAFQALDRQTDATMLLLAAPSHSQKLHLLSSRSIRREPSLSKSPAIKSLKTGFKQIASQRRNARAQKLSLAHRFLVPVAGSPSSEASTEGREEDLKKALNIALSSLQVMGGMYDQREARWREEMHRLTEDRKRIELFLQQAFGDTRSPSMDTAIASPAEKIP